MAVEIKAINIAAARKRISELASETAEDARFPEFPWFWHKKDCQLADLIRKNAEALGKDVSKAEELDDTLRAMFYR